MGGSQRGKTGTEKELLYSKVAVREKLWIMAMIMEEMPRAWSVLLMIFYLKQYNIPGNTVETLMESCCADGDGIDMVKCNGKCFLELYKNMWKCTCDLFFLLYYSSYEFFLVKCSFVKAVSRIVLGTQ